MRKRNHQIIVRLDDEELLMLKGAADKILDHMVILRINSVSVFLEIVYIPEDSFRQEKA